MKRTLILLMALLLIGTAGMAEDAVYQSDFTRGTDGWYARSGGGARVSADDGALHIEGRSADWHSPGRDFDLVPGGKYQLSAQVRQTQRDSAAFMISVAHTADGVESYENLARATAKKGEWTTLQGSYTAGEFDRFVLYVETTGASDLAYDLRDFCVTAPDGVPERKPTAAPMILEPAADLPSLKDVYAGKFDFGAALPASAFRNAALIRLVKEQFSILTPENELKPDSVLDVAASRRLVAQDETAAAVHFDSARPLLDFARDNGIKVHGHVLVWHSQTPEAFFHQGYDPAKPFVSREVMLGRLENYIRGVMDFLQKNYPGVVVSWDVVNEAIDDGTAKLRVSNWTKVVGDDFVQQAFALARKYAPAGTLLYYNDYNTAMPGKLNGIVKLLESLIPGGCIDGYGFQMHHSVGSPSMEQISASVHRIAALALRLRVSELDVGTSGNSEDSFRRQADKYARIMKLLLSCSDSFEAVQVWGVTDPMSWRAANYPLLFDGRLNPKPAFWAVADPDSVP